MKKGDIVNIYEDPLTKKVFEARAVLKLNIYKNKYIERWLVIFVDGGELTEARRNISTDIKVADMKVNEWN